LGGRTTENVIELTELEENRRLAMRGVSGFPFGVEITIDLIAVPTGTQVNWTTELRPRGLVRPFGPLLGAMFRASFQKDLQKLRTMMEAGDL
jgi:hypothetical protein